MPRSNEHVEVILACRQCKQQFMGKRYLGGKITSIGLKCHLKKKRDKTRKGNDECFEYYSKDKTRRKFGYFDLNSSIVKILPVRKPPREQPFHQSSPVLDYGLTGTSNGPCPVPEVDVKSLKRQKIDHSTLNRQTLPVGYQPSVCRENIVASVNQQTGTESVNILSSSSGSTKRNSCLEQEVLLDDDDTSDCPTSLLSVDASYDLETNTLDETSSPCDDIQNDDNEDQDGLPFGDLEQDFDDELPIQNDDNEDQDGLPFCDLEQDCDDELPEYVGVPQRNILPMKDTLIAEVELLHLIEKYKLHMNVFAPIWQWAVDSQSRRGHNFSSTSPRTRNTILKDMQDHFRHSRNPDNSATNFSDEFGRVMTTVLPDYTPVDLFVRPFQVALNSLLLI